VINLSLTLCIFIVVVCSLMRNYNYLRNIMAPYLSLGRAGCCWRIKDPASAKKEPLIVMNIGGCQKNRAPKNRIRRRMRPKG
jgi:hypothetical protein